MVSCLGPQTYPFSDVQRVQQCSEITSACIVMVECFFFVILFSPECTLIETVLGFTARGGLQFLKRESPGKNSSRPPILSFLGRDLLWKRNPRDGM